MHIVFHRFTAWYRLRVTDNLETMRVSAGECMQALPQIRIGVRDMFVEPELNAGCAGFRRFDQIRKDVRIGTKYITGKSQAMPESDVEIDIHGNPRGRSCVIEFSCHGR